MRKLVGCLLLIAGVSGLGYVGTTQNAVRIQSAIADQARTVAAGGGMPQTRTVRVSGRDVSVSGLVLGETGVAGLKTELENIDGVRVVDVSRLDTLPVVTPFSMRLYWADGVVKVAGSVPTPDAFASFPEGSDLILAAGVPDDNWIKVARTAQTAVAQLQSGAALLTERTLMIEGVAKNPDDRDAILATLMPLPNGYSLDDDISVEDDGTPLRLTLTLRDETVVGAGKFPSEIMPNAIADIFGTREGVTITQAVIPAFDPQWPVVASTAMAGLSQLIDGVLEMEGRNVSLIGTGTPGGIAQAGALLAMMPDTYNVIADLGLWDDGAPLEFTMQWDGSVASASGKFPAGFALRDPAGVAVANAGTNSLRPAETLRFSTNSAIGISALGIMSTGTLRVTETAITLTGTAASPQVGLAMDSVLAKAAPDTEITREITYLDDGSPAAWTLTYDAAIGAMIEGRLPSGLAIGDIDLALGLDAIAGTPATALDDNNVGSSLETLQIVADYLPEIETLTFALSDDQSALDLVLSPGVDLDLIANDLAERLPTDVAFSLKPLEDLPETGTTRTNVATGLGEIFTDGFWLPNVAFDVDVAACGAQTLSILNRGQIGFLSSSARLDAASIRTINALAAVILRCVAADLTLEVGGHTDASGAELTNNALSQDRADAVRAALIARGVPDIAMTAFGFGQSQPVADNATPEGRAANRRTDITWFAVGALRDP